MLPITRSRQRSTLAGVAREAGVSVGTVSKVLNGRSDVAPATRARVQALLVKHDYVARGAGGAQQATRALHLIFDAMRTPNNLEIIRGVLEAVSDEGIDVVTGLVPSDPLGAAWARRVAQTGCLGLILVTSPLTDQQWRQFQQADVQLVTIDPVRVPDQNVLSVGSTNFAGGMEATRHLISLGHRRIGLIEGPQEAMVSAARLHGYQAALTEGGLNLDPALVQPAEFTFEEGLRAAEKLIAGSHRPTGIFASNDLQALGAIEAARAIGLRVPEDLSVVGFDDMPAAQWSAPPLTTVRQPLAEMGRVAAEALLRLTAGEQLQTTRIELAAQLVLRKSTAPATTT